MKQIRQIGLFIALFLLTQLLQGQNSTPYFQQQVNHKIDVLLNDTLHELHGFETVQYINNSRQTLEFIYFHLWPNAYSNNETAMALQLRENGKNSFFYAHDSLRGFIDSLDFRINGAKLKWEYDPQHIDVAKVFLPQNLEPGDSIEITTPFRVKFPGDFSRMGHVGQSYQVTQWYPKPAVFDKEGWHPMPYLDQGEFYNEYGSYEVSITLPKNYVVGATGDLQDQEEREWLLDRATKTSGKLMYSESLSFPKSESETKTITYKQHNVHDFAWFADKRYHVLRGEVELPYSKRKVETWAMFTNREADLWKDAIKYLNQAIYAYSKWNGEYPYNQVTALYGALSAGGGMEYPNVTVIGDSYAKGALENVIVHEVGHNWFQGILGFNERQQPAMDEGINTFNEMRYAEEYMEGFSLIGEQADPWVLKWQNLHNLDHRGEFYLMYQFQARANKDQPLNLPAQEYTDANYGAIVYAKKGLSVQMLRASLGDSLFDKGMKAFFKEWKFRHPTRQDWQRVMERETKKDLAWFFNEYYQTTSRIDYKTKRVKRKGSELEVTIKNKGKISAPFSLTAYSKAGKELYTKPIDIRPFEKEKITLPYQNANRVKLDAKLDLVEHNRRNNTIKTKGILKKAEPLQLKIFTSSENPDKTQLFYSPLVGWNTADELMIGWAFYNKSYIQKPFEWYIGPMYSFHRNALTGIGDFSYHIYPKGFRSITANFNLMRFAYDIPGQGYMTYERYYPKLIFELMPKRERSPIRQKINAGVLHLEELYHGESLAFINTVGTFGKAGYSFRYSRFNQEVGFKIGLTVHDQFTQGDYEVRYRLFYNKRKSAFTARLFAGNFFTNTSGNPIFNLRMDGQTGFYDYQKNQIFPDRAGTHDVWKNQMNENHGAFKTPTSFGQSSLWLGALNLKAEAPFWLPVGAYADLGVAEKTDLLFNAGLYLRIIRDICEVYFPMYWSNNIDNMYKANGTEYHEQIRFTLNLPLVNPYKLVQSFSL